MSADNGIYILKTKTHDDQCEWRVKHLLGYEDHLTEEKKRIEIARKLWKDSDVFNNEEDAFKYAIELLHDLMVCEYGINYVSIDEAF